MCFFMAMCTQDGESCLLFLILDETVELPGPDRSLPLKEGIGLSGFDVTGVHRERAELAGEVFALLKLEKATSQWERTPLNWFKLYSDGSSLGNLGNKASAVAITGVIIKVIKNGDHSFFLSVFSSQILDFAHFGTYTDFVISIRFD
ncbi:hypothetical protein GQ457_01G002760 [Hibiscus cannabinus]